MPSRLSMQSAAPPVSPMAPPGRGGGSQPTTQPVCSDLLETVQLWIAWPLYGERKTGSSDSPVKESASHPRRNQCPEPDTEGSLRVGTADEPSPVTLALGLNGDGTIHVRDVSIPPAIPG